ncbi:MAG: non-canonical purine NTP pyrophosphatase [Actinomycetota bacterium]|nr:non-canonical purine NTP pyrophosphatase [Actinomycetota bacterium]
MLATRNPHKQREFARLLRAHTVERLAQDVALPPEVGATFAENALAKARAAATALGAPAIADDSGIEAAALDGAPGIRSARFAGATATDAENLARLRREAPVGSALAYVCVLAYVDPGARIERTFDGRCAGMLASQPRGEGGFGYDPVFLPGGRSDGRTMAELSDAEKDEISHRGRAARSLDRWLVG